MFEKLLRQVYINTAKLNDLTAMCQQLLEMNLTSKRSSPSDMHDDDDLNEVTCLFPLDEENIAKLEDYLKSAKNKSSLVGSIKDHCVLTYLGTNISVS